MMRSGMASEAGTTTAKPVLRRDREHRVIGGVCAGIANRVDVDPLVVRIVFVAAAAAGGAGFFLYALAWLVMPVGDATDDDARPRSPRAGGRASVEVALGVALLLLAVLLGLRALGVWFSDALVWPLVLIAGGGALLWRQSASNRPPAPADDGAAHPAEDLRALGHGAAVVSRVGLGIALVVAAGLVFLQTTDSLSAARDVVLAVVVVVVVLAAIFAPWIVRLVRSLSAERAERIRSQERAEMAAHLHDSVLQTLTLMQKRSSDPREVAGLARRQERELRAWLSGRSTADASHRMLGALENAAGEVEERSGVPVEVVAVGDCDLDSGAEAMVAAAREAMLNAAKFGGGSTVDVFAELANGRKQLFVRDRGPGFDPAAIPADRRGVRESIVGRMARHGGRATIHSTPGEGTEVELVLERNS